MINQAFEYVKRLNNFEDKEALQMATELLKHENLDEYESAMLNNLDTGKKVELPVNFVRFHCSPFTDTPLIIQN